MFSLVGSGGGGGSVGRAVASNFRGLRVISSHPRIYYSLTTVENTKINKKRPGMAI